MSHVRCPHRGALMFPMSCERHSPFLPPAAAPHPLRTPSALAMTVSLSRPLTWSHSHQRQCHNGVRSMKTFNWDAASFGPRHCRTVQTGDVWLSLHLMSKLTWVAGRCSNAICSFPFMLFLQINKSPGVQWLQALCIHYLAWWLCCIPPLVGFHKFIVSSPL